VFLREAQRRHPDDFWLNTNLFELFITTMRPPQPEEAVRFAAVAVALRPGSFSAHNHLGGALRANGRLDEAIAEFQLAIALDPKVAKPHLGLGLALTARGRLDEAIAEYQLAIALDPKEVGAHRNLGDLLEGKGQFAEALVHRRRGHELGSKQPTGPIPRPSWSGGVSVWWNSIANCPRS
jgi:Flp pilus assembly protein TadD